MREAESRPDVEAPHHAKDRIGRLSARIRRDKSVPLPALEEPLQSFAISDLVLPPPTRPLQQKPTLTISGMSSMPVLVTLVCDGSQAADGRVQTVEKAYWLSYARDEVNRDSEPFGFAQGRLSLGA